LSPDANAPATERRTRSAGELVQLLGATSAAQLKVEEIPAPTGGPTLEVHPQTQERLHWKPEFYAISNDGALRIEISRVEADSLIAAGASPSR
jgi:hypothetical protein